MPIIKSAKKRVRLAKQATVRNVRTKRTMKTAVKTFQASLDKGGAKAADAYREAQSAVAQAGKKNVLHKNKVARKQRQLAAQAKANGVKVAGTAKAKAKPTAKSATKKPVAKKPAAKKPAAKKATK